MTSTPDQDSYPMIVYFTDKYHQTVTNTCCKKIWTAHHMGEDLENGVSSAEV